MFFLQCFWLFFCIVHYTLAKKDVLTMSGDIILGGLFDVHQLGSNERECGPFNEIPGYQNMEAMLYAIEKINKRQDVLPGIKLGTVIYDTCRSPTISADKTKEFIKFTLLPTTMNGSELAGVIGPFISGNSVIAANLLRVFRIPQISYGSLTVLLSNKQIYNYFFRTVPPDSFFAVALVKLLERMGWNYVSIVYSTGTWSETGAQEVVNAMKRYNICLSDYLTIKRFPTDKDFDGIIDTLAQNGDHVVILVTLQRDSRGLLTAAKRRKKANKNRLYFIGSVAWSNRGDITEDLESTADGVLTFGHPKQEIPEFEGYFRSLLFNNYSRNNKEWIGEYWQHTNKCKLMNFTVASNYTTVCTGDEKNTKYKEMSPVQVVINAIEAMANALHKMHRRLCPNTTKMCKEMKPLNRTMLLEFLRNVTYKDAAFHYPVTFNTNQEVDGNYTLYNFRLRNGSYGYVQVGSWTSTLKDGLIIGKLLLDQSQITWHNGSKMIPLSSCKPYCRFNEVRLLRDDKCCWECKACRVNDVIINNTCVPCDGGYIPNEKLSSCSKLPLHYVNIDTPLSIFISFLSFLGIFADVIVCGIFVKHSQNRLIKATGREMCYFMFVGIAAVFAIPLTCLARPTVGLCYFRCFIMGISFTICYAPLLMKLWRIHRIFRTTNHLKRISPTGLMGPHSLILVTFGLIAIQGLFCILVFNTDPPHLVETFYEKKNELVLECGFKKSSFSVYFSYNIVLLLCCTFYAFITRHFPKNFNEAMVIGITMYLTCITWVIFFATFLNAEYSISRVYWISGCSLVTGWVTLLGLFAPKVYQLYTKAEFPKGMLLSWNPSLSGVKIANLRPRDEVQHGEHHDNEATEQNSAAIFPLKKIKQSIVFSNPINDQHSASSSHSRNINERSNSI